MNAQMALTPVTLMPHAKTFLGISLVSVIKDTVEMDFSVMVIMGVVIMGGLAGGPIIMSFYKRQTYLHLVAIDCMALPFFVQDNKYHSEVCRMICTS